MEYIKSWFGMCDTRYYYLSLIKEPCGWSIHGLWPQYSKNSYPKYCKKVTFSYETLTPIIDRLNAVWYSNEEPNQDFWQHEWEKHGSCMFTDMNELQYFQKALELYKEAIEQNLPEKFANGNKSMIPLDLNFNFIN